MTRAAVDPAKQAGTRELPAALGVIGGGVIVAAGLAGGILPMYQRRAPCLYSVTPPEAFAERYLEGIEAEGPALTVFPFGAQCSYIAPSTGETALSTIPLRPT